MLVIMLVTIIKVRLIIRIMILMISLTMMELNILKLIISTSRRCILIKTNLTIRKLRMTT